MPISTVNTKIRLTMLCLSGFELFSRWVPLSSKCYKTWLRLLMSSEPSANQTLDLRSITHFRIA